MAEDGSRKPASAYKRQRVTGPDGRPLMRHGRPVYRVLRPGWQQVLTDLGTGAATAVLAEDLDRVARDPRDIEDLIDAVAACGGHARSLSGSLTLTDGGSSDQLAMARVMVTMAAKSSADTARRVTAGRERWAGAELPGRQAALGYRPDPDAPEHRKTLIIVAAEAKVIRQAAADILDRGISLKAVARDLRDRRVPHRDRDRVDRVHAAGRAGQARRRRDRGAHRTVKDPGPARCARSPRSTRRRGPRSSTASGGSAARPVRRPEDRHQPGAALAAVRLRDVRAVRRGGEVHRVGRPPRLHVHRPRARPPERRRGR